MNKTVSIVLFVIISVGFVAELFRDHPEPSVLALYIVSGFLAFMQGFYPEFWDRFIKNHTWVALAIMIAALGVLGWWLFLAPAASVATKIGAVVIGVVLYFFLRTYDTDRSDNGRIHEPEDIDGFHHDDGR